MFQVTVPPSLTELIAELEGCSSTQLLDELQSDQRRRWAKGERLPVEVYRGCLPAPLANGELFLGLVYSEVLLREGLGERPRAEEYCRRFPDLAEQVEQLFQVHTELIDPLLNFLDRSTPTTSTPHHSPPNSRSPTLAQKGPTTRTS